MPYNRRANRRELLSTSNLRRDLADPEFRSAARHCCLAWALYRAFQALNGTACNERPGTTRQDVGNAAKPHCRASGRASAFLEIDSERENFLARDTALYGYVAPQLRGFAALGGFGALRLPAVAQPPTALWP